MPPSVKIFLVFSRAFWAEPNRLPLILYNNSSTQQNGASAVSDDIIRNVGISIFMLVNLRTFVMVLVVKVVVVVKVMLVMKMMLVEK